MAWPPREMAMLFSTAVLRAFWQSYLWLRGRSFGCRSFRLDAKHFRFMEAASVLHRWGLVSKATVLMMVLFSMRNVNEGDVPCCFSSAGNTIKSEFIYASSLLIACSQNVALEVRSFLASKADPCTFVKPSYDQGPKIGPPGNEHEPINTKSCNEGPSFGSPGNSGSETMQKPSYNQGPQLGPPGNDHKSIIEQF